MKVDARHWRELDPRRLDKISRACTFNPRESSKFRLGGFMAELTDAIKKLSLEDFYASEDGQREKIRAVVMNLEPASFRQGVQADLKCNKTLRDNWSEFFQYLEQLNESAEFAFLASPPQAAYVSAGTAAASRWSRSQGQQGPHKISQ